MKIAFVGAAGTGKTTLTNLIAEDLKFPVIKEGVREKLAKTGKDLKYFKTHLSEGIQFQKELLEERIIAENESNDFVSDRSSLDNLLYFTVNYSSHAPINEYWDYYNKCIENAHKYDYLFFLYSVIPIENDGVRETHIPYIKMTEFIILGILEHFKRFNLNNTKIIYIPEHIKSLNEREKFILEKVRL